LGTPCILIGLLVPILPAGLVMWVGYRTWCNWTGSGLGRRATGWHLVDANDRAPRWRGLLRGGLTSAAPMLGLLIGGIALAAAAPSSVGSLIATSALSALAAAATTLVLFSLMMSGVGSGAPLVDRICNLQARRRVRTARRSNRASRP
jgi:hypothetical protein